jgi:hypothetical protein
MIDSNRHTAAMARRGLLLIALLLLLLLLLLLVGYAGSSSSSIMLNGRRSRPPGCCWVGPTAARPRCQQPQRQWWGRGGEMQMQLMDRSGGLLPELDRGDIER